MASNTGRQSLRLKYAKKYLNDPATDKELKQAQTRHISPVRLRKNRGAMHDAKICAIKKSTTKGVMFQLPVLGMELKSMVDDMHREEAEIRERWKMHTIHLLKEEKQLRDNGSLLDEKRLNVLDDAFDIISTKLTTFTDLLVSIKNIYRQTVRQKEEEIDDVRFMSTKMQRMLGEELNPRLIEQEIRRQEIAADLKEGLIRENMLTSFHLDISEVIFMKRFMKHMEEKSFFKDIDISMAVDGKNDLKAKLVHLCEYMKQQTPIDDELLYLWIHMIQSKPEPFCTKMEKLDAYTEEWHDLKITGKHVKLLDLVQGLVRAENDITMNLQNDIIELDSKTIRLEHQLEMMETTNATKKKTEPIPPNSNSE